MYTSQSVEQKQHGNWILSIALLPVCIYYVFKGSSLLSGSEITILDTLCMLVFDAGRMLAGAVSDPLTHIGGIAILVLLPAYLVWYFATREYRIGIQVFLFWLGQDLIFLGRTAIEAESKAAPLLNKYQFDVHTVLTYLRMTESAEVLGQLLFMFGTVCFVVLLVLPRYMSR